MGSGDDIEALERKVAKLEENVAFLRDLLGHIRTQFDDFRKEIEKRR